MSLEDAIQNAARDLPEGYSINIQVERDYGCVALSNDAGNTVEIGPEDCDESMAACVKRFTQKAIEWKRLEAQEESTP